MCGASSSTAYRLPPTCTAVELSVASVASPALRAALQLLLREQEHAGARRQTVRYEQQVVATQGRLLRLGLWGARRFRDMQCAVCGRNSHAGFVHLVLGFGQDTGLRQTTTRRNGRLGRVSPKWHRWSTMIT
jgi:hypothetical protein